MDVFDSKKRSHVDRPPANLREVLSANCRPQPAIPAVFVFILFVLLPILSQSPETGAEGSDIWLALLIAAGIVGSAPTI